MQTPLERVYELAQTRQSVALIQELQFEGQTGQFELTES